MCSYVRNDMRKVLALLFALSAVGCGSQSGAEEDHSLKGVASRALRSLYQGDGEAFLSVMDFGDSLDADMQHRLRDMLHFRRQYESGNHGGVRSVEVTDIQMGEDSTGEVFFRVLYSDQTSLPGAYRVEKKGADWKFIVRD